MIITFIGNCQTLSLCFYFQLLHPENDNIRWLLYGESFKPHAGPGWSSKCKNKVFDYDQSHKIIRESDVIVFQEVRLGKSAFCNAATLTEMKKESCKLIQIPCFYLDYDDYANSLKELQRREDLNKVDVKISDIIAQNRSSKLMLTINHPNTFILLEAMKKLCVLIGLEFFPPLVYRHIMQNDNFMGLPV